MTFTLKNISQLKIDFQKTIDLMLTSNKKTDIANLEEPIHSQILFIKELLSLVHKSAPSKLNPPEWNQIVYGAMLVVVNNTPANQMLIQSLTNILDIEAESAPSINQQLKYLSALNQFINDHIFINKDSRKGLREDHSFKSLPSEYLKSLLQTSYKLAQNLGKSAINYNDDPGKKTVKYKEYKSVTANITKVLENVPEWDILKSQLATTITLDKVKHGVGTIELLPPERAAQLFLLEKLIEILDQTSLADNEKRAILAGGMYWVAKKIQPTYTIRNPDCSVVYNQFNSNLKISQSPPQNAEVLIHTFHQFFTFLTTMKIDNKVIINNGHPFNKIKGLDLHDTMDFFHDLIYKYREETLDLTFDQPKTNWSLLRKLGLYSSAESASGKKEVVVQPPTDLPTTGLSTSP